jgi:hypothetical protein
MELVNKHVSKEGRDCREKCRTASLVRTATSWYEITNSVADTTTLEPEAKRWNFISATIFSNLVKLLPDAIKIIDN